MIPFQNLTAHEVPFDKRIVQPQPIHILKHRRVRKERLHSANLTLHRRRRVWRHSITRIEQPDEIVAEELVGAELGLIRYIEPAVQIRQYC